MVPDNEEELSLAVLASAVFNRKVTAALTVSSQPCSGSRVVVVVVVGVSMGRVGVVLVSVVIVLGSSMLVVVVVAIVEIV